MEDPLATAELSCTIDAADRIVAVSPAWDAAALAQGGEAAVSARVIGTPILSHVAGEATRRYVAEALARVREDGRPRVLPYRCDLPGLRRDMELILEPEAPGLVRMRHRVVSTRQLPAAMAAARGRAAAPRPVAPSLCSMCNAEWRGREWVPTEGPTGGLGARFVICPDCTERLSRRQARGPARG